MRYSWVAVSIGAVVVWTIGIGIWLSASMGGGRLDAADGQPPLPVVQLQQAPGGPLEVEVADEPEERANGLSGRRGSRAIKGCSFSLRTPVSTRSG